MGDLAQVTIDFDRSHLIFPTVIAVVLGLLGLTILIRDRHRIAAAGGAWSRTFAQMDRTRFFGTLALVLGYFGLMIPVGNIWPNTGMGFLLCSIPFVFLTGLLYMHEHGAKQVIPLAVIALVIPTFVWWLFTYPFFLTLP